MPERKPYRSIFARLGVGRSRSNSRERGTSEATSVLVPTTPASLDVPSLRAAPTAPVPTPAAPLGLICLTPDLGEEHVIPGAPDIVAIHGINGHAYKTWTHENGAFWLQDFLPEQIPG